MDIFKYKIREYNVKNPVFLLLTNALYQHFALSFPGAEGGGVMVEHFMQISGVVS